MTMTGRYWMVVRPGLWSPAKTRHRTRVKALKQATGLVQRAKRRVFVQYGDQCPVRVFVVTVSGDDPDAIAYEAATYEAEGRALAYPNAGRSIDTELQAEVDSMWQHYFIHNPDQKRLEEEN